MRELLESVLDRSPTGRVTVILSGPSGSGKSAVAAELLRSVPGDLRFAGLDVDDAYLDRFASFPRPDLEDGWQLARRDAARRVRDWLGHDRRLVLLGGNCLFRPDQLMDVVPTLTGISDLHHVTLAPSPATIRRNIRRRGDLPRLEWVKYDQAIRRPFTDCSWTVHLDTSKMTVGETLSNVCERLLAAPNRFSAAPFTADTTGLVETIVA